MVKAIKVMLVPNNVQNTKMFEYAGAARFAYNWTLAREKENYGKGGKFISDSELRKEFNTHVKFEGFSSGKKANKQKLNWVRLAEHGRIPTDTKYMNPRISFDGFDWWISVCVEFPDCKEELSDDGLGIDLGIKDLAVCSDTNKYKSINKSQTMKKLEKRRRRVQRSISRKYEQL